MVNVACAVPKLMVCGTSLSSLMLGQNPMSPFRLNAKSIIPAILIPLKRFESNHCKVLLEPFQEISVC